MTVYVLRAGAVKRELDAIRSAALPRWVDAILALARECVAWSLAGS
jgi:hypothetical protein